MNPNPTPNPSWHLVAGEFPPCFGGVSAYSALLADGLAASGAPTHVWTVGPGQPDDDRPGRTVHRVGLAWDPSAFRAVSRALDARPEPGRRLLVQYTPNSFGARGMNRALGRWLARRARLGDDVRVMFHELWYFPVPGDRLARRALHVVQRLLVRSLVQSCSRVYVAIPHWGDLIRESRVGRRRPITWLPVPSNIPVRDDPAGVAAVRRRLGGSSGWIGHFGTYSGRTEELLSAALPAVLEACPGTSALLVGPGGEAFAERTVAARPGLAGRLVATGALDDPEVSRHLQACDLFVQPYPDGVTSRRGSVMAVLAHGKAVLTTFGSMTEPVWIDSGAVAMVPEGDVEGLAREAAVLLADRSALDRLGAAGQAAYDRRFALERTVEALRDEGQVTTSRSTCSTESH